MTTEKASTRKLLEGKHFILAGLATRLGRDVQFDPQTSRLTLFDVARTCAFKSRGRAAYYWQRGSRIGPQDPAAPFIPPKSFEPVREYLVGHARAFLAGLEERRKKVLEELDRQKEAAEEVLKRFGE